MAHVLDTLRKPGVSWRMLRPVALLLSLAAPAPLVAQVGLASSSQSVILTATRQGSVGIGLAPGVPASVATAWDLRPDDRTSVTLIASFDPAGSGPGRTDTRVLFVQPVAEGSDQGQRTDRLGIRTGAIGDTLAGPAPRRGTLTLRAITQ